MNSPSPQTIDFEDFSRYRTLPPGPEKQKLRDSLVKKHYPLVIHTINKYVLKRRVGSAQKSPPINQDLLQDASIGLLKAIDKYDPSRGFAFSSFATSWIRNEALQHFSDKTKLIRVPNYVKSYSKHVMKQLEDSYRIESGIESGTKVTWENLCDHYENIDQAIFSVASELGYTDKAADGIVQAIRIKHDGNFVRVQTDTGAEQVVGQDVMNDMSRSVGSLEHLPDRLKAVMVVVDTLRNMPVKRRNILLLRHGVITKEEIEKNDREQQGT